MRSEISLGDVFTLCTLRCPAVTESWDKTMVTFSSSFRVDTYEHPQLDNTLPYAKGPGHQKMSNVQSQNVNSGGAGSGQSSVHPNP